jgi:predicted helicase
VIRVGKIWEAELYMTALSQLLDVYRQAAVTEREKGTYFEDLIVCYLRNEATYKDLYSDVWTYGQWAEIQGLDRRDAGIDLVAKTNGTDEYHAIQCKLYAETYKLRKEDIDSFFTASGKKPFTHRIIVSTTNHWSEHAENALRDQQPPVSKIDLHDLENSQIDWAKYQPKAPPPLKPKKTLRDHQQTALTATLSGFKAAERGKLIMACGTGKTFTSLKIAEAQAGPGKRVLFLVPSLSLLSQTLSEWTQESVTPLHSFAVCSDSEVGKRRTKGIPEDDAVQTIAHELRYPATTEPGRLATEMLKRHDSDHMSVVFSTYHSIDVIHQAQHHHGLADFDLIICDEAHRTTGAIFDSEDESAFVRVHNAEYIRSAKRLYMTATPRIYGDNAKASAEKESVALCSMDDEALYGRELYVITFSEAVRRGLLVDYKVIVLSVDAKHISHRLQSLLKDDDNQLKVDDAGKIVGCWKALAKQGLTEDLNGDTEAMKRAVAFCQVIEIPTKAKVHKVSSKNIANMFQRVVEAYQEKEEIDPATRLICEAAHVDGGMNASEKEAKIDWLKAETPDQTCRILSNVRCLSEGVDVPALDAVLFLTPRSSQIDVVQSVGRVMRNSPGKKRGYVILPVVIPDGMEPHEALNDNKTFSVVWQVLQALRSHDDRFDAMVNKLDLIGKDPSKMEVIAITDKMPTRQAKALSVKKQNTGKGSFGIGALPARPAVSETQATMQFEIGEIERAIYAKLVQKVGNRHHWEDWANDIAKIAQTHITRITTILESQDNTVEREAFASFAAELRGDLNDSLGEAEIIEMLAQHVITKPVFDALFEGYNFAEANPMSIAMQKMLDVLEGHRLDKEADTLQRFYDSVKERAKGIENATGKQKIIVELYDKFFRNAFPRMTERLGIVYTPVEVVDFIIHSVNDILKVEFGQTLGSEGVHILDPFTGTGTFITRLLQSGLIAPEELPWKYKSEIHANELVLLAYYIAAINIEATYHGVTGGNYLPFEGICLTDTFQNHANADLVGGLLATNNSRRKRQDTLDIRVIMANPPYSATQKSENDNNSNVEYPSLDERIRSTYAKAAQTVNLNRLYDSYIRAIRWASDRIGQSGVIGFVTNAGYLDSNATDGLRKCLAKEFSSMYIVHLRGNARTSGELRRKEKDNVFGTGSRAPIAISLFVKNPLDKNPGRIYLYDIGNYLSQAEKLQKIANFQGISGIGSISGWQSISPNEHGDWLGQRDDSFKSHIILGDKRGTDIKIFDNYSYGVNSARAAWCYNSSKAQLEFNMQRMIEFYNGEVSRYEIACQGIQKNEYPNVDDFVDSDPTKISWAVNEKNLLARGVNIEFFDTSVSNSLYRPFTRQWLYFDRHFIHSRYQMPNFFPDASAENFVICTSGVGAGNGFSVLISAAIPDFQTMFNGQCFPLYLYDVKEAKHDTPHNGGDLFALPTQIKKEKRTRRDAITDASLAHFRAAYPWDNISKEDIFYYVYGLLHSPDYRDRYADNLSKELPRIPCVKAPTDFWAFSKAGRDLADLHLNYETVAPFPLKIDTGNQKLTDADYRVEKMRYGKKGGEKDLTTLLYNGKITLTGIPLEAYDYVVNGKPALDWVLERQCVKTDKDSGIINDANDWAIETMHNPRYPLELFMRVITVSLETMKIVKALPPLDID